MTAPVIQETDKEDSKSTTFSFVMPQNFTLETLPLPLDERITFKEIPAKSVAVREYSSKMQISRLSVNQALHGITLHSHYGSCVEMRL